MRRSIAIFSATMALAFTGAVAALADEKSEPAKGKEIIKCAITKQDVEKSKAIEVKTMSGKSVWVCCKGCVAAAKQLK